jgi:VTC domain
MSTIWPALTSISGPEGIIMTIHFPRPPISSFTNQFAPISLQSLNEKAEMLARIDNKYVVPRNVMDQIAPALADQFDVLDIAGRRVFTYDTRYFDDANRSAYYEHHQGVRQGFKVRARRYVDANLSYLEVKLKGLRGMTVKHRLPLEEIPKTRLDAAAYGFARTTYADHYGKDFDYDLRAALDIRYQRITLVAKSGGERMTIDTNLCFRNGRNTLDVGSEVFIVEAKSALGRGFADKLLRAEHVRPSKRCSKYCIGVAVLGEVTRFNHFLPVIRKLGLADAAPLALAPPAQLGAA